MFPDYQQDISAVVIKGNHVVGDGGAWSKIFIALANKLEL